ncbi:MAG: NTP transferase domain-containing protein [Deltaproteobacteria bacterium]|jgi:choline kinase|nr:NTP transferase domain-containing protein [Deltaproteobacteria bacterium]
MTVTTSPAPYQAVLLAAGRGSRFGQRTEEIPKALLPIGPRSLDDHQPTSFLQRQCELLRAAGVEQIVVVAGYLKEMLLDAVNSWDLGVQVVVNNAPDINSSGSLHSFQFAARAGIGVLDGKHQTLMIDADIVYHSEMLRRFIAAPARTSMLVCSTYQAGAEEVLVYGTASKPRFMGKGLGGELVCAEPCLGEATGMVKFAPGDHRAARKTIDWMLGDPDAPLSAPERRGFGPARQATEHEELTQRFMHYRKIDCVIFSGDELPFMEVDSEQEYAYLRDAFYPRLLRLEQESTR